MPIRLAHHALAPNPIVGRHLLASIREVLRGAATDELVDAWAAAYGQLADLMIKVESGIYEAQANAEGGWSGWRPFVVAKRLDETADVVSFYLKPADGGKVPAWKPGQFVSVRAYLPELNLMLPCVKLGARPGVEAVRALALSPDADAYPCGPGGFMADMKAALEAAGVSAKQNHAEVVGTGGEV